MDSEKPHKRQSARFAAALPAVVHLDGKEHPCAAEDLSRRGVLLIGPLPEPQASELTVTITTAAGDRSLRASGRVAHFRPAASAEDEARIGLHFGTLSPEQLEQLDALVSRVVEGMAPAALASIGKGATLAEVRRALGRISVAHRVALATRAGPNERAILQKDTEAAVLEALARNPNIVLPEIKALLRRPDLLPSTLEVIASDSRWLPDEEVKLMIATHPRVTFGTADKVVARLNELQIQRLLRRPGLQVGMRQKLMSKLSGKYRNS